MWLLKLERVMKKETIGESHGFPLALQELQREKAYSSLFSSIYVSVSCCVQIFIISDSE